MKVNDERSRGLKALWVSVVRAPVRRLRHGSAKANQPGRETLPPSGVEDDSSVSDLVPFRVVERRDQDDVLRITLIGELDLAVADRLSARLDQLSSDRTRVRLDLSRLTFIDSSGIRSLIRAAQHVSENGEQLIEFAPEVTQVLER
jgi:anti-sigma B factor antagonist